MDQKSPKSLRIGCIDGKPKRVNERVVDGLLIKNMGEYCEWVKIPPLQIFKLFGGSVQNWLQKFPASLSSLSEGLGELCARYDIKTLYLNLPLLNPYFFMARNLGGLDLGFMCLGHSVGSEFWLKQSVSIAPWLTRRDVMLSSTQSCQKALMKISDRFRITLPAPYCIEVPEESADLSTPRGGNRLLSIGRIEDVKNIHVLLEVFAALRERLPELTLTVAGEYTGSSPEAIEEYKQKIAGLIARHKLESSVRFPGAVVGPAKDMLFKTSDLLLNLSTDPGETFGYNNIEAKCWGLPVVCSNWDGFQEVIEHGGDGLFADCRWDESHPVLDQGQVVEACLTLLRDPALWKEYSLRAMKNASRFDYRAVIPKVLAAIEEASAHKLDPHPQVPEIAGSTIAELSSVFHTENLKTLPFFHTRLIDITESASTCPLDLWMPMVRPLIHHFAGRIQYAGV